MTTSHPSHVFIRTSQYSLPHANATLGASRSQPNHKLKLSSHQTKPMKNLPFLVTDPTYLHVGGVCRSILKWGKLLKSILIYLLVFCY